MSEIILALVYVGVTGFILDRIVAAVATVVTRGTAAN
jgi:nitrate/nitrite transport system permease protein